jgi:ATP-dependent Clp protease ATP-binding subunit ClpC
MGARPLRRVIQNKVEDPLSDRLLAGEFRDGDTILVDMNEETKEILLTRAEGEPEAPEAAVEVSI